MGGETVVKKYTHKFRQIVTGKYLLRYTDERSEAPKSEPYVKLTSGTLSWIMSVEEARDLEHAIHLLINRLPEKTEEVPND